MKPSDYKGPSKKCTPAYPGAGIDVANSVCCIITGTDLSGNEITSEITDVSVLVDGEYVPVESLMKSGFVAFFNVSDTTKIIKE